MTQTETKAKYILQLAQVPLIIDKNLTPNGRKGKSKLAEILKNYQPQI